MSNEQEQKDTAKFHQALLEVQKELGPIKKQASNPFFKSKYATLEALLDLVVPILNKHGMRLTQKNGIANHPQGLMNLVTSAIIHAETGYKEESTLALPNIEDPQKMKSATTYYRRTTLTSLLSIRELDDDGNVAAGKAKPKTSPKNTFGL